MLAQVSLRKLEAIMEAGAKETAPSQVLGVWTYLVPDHIF